MQIRGLALNDQRKIVPADCGQEICSLPVTAALKRLVEQLTMLMSLPARALQARFEV
jgi:hypothetical protein